MKLRLLIKIDENSREGLISALDEIKSHVEQGDLSGNKKFLDDEIYSYSIREIQK